MGWMNDPAPEPQELRTPHGRVGVAVARQDHDLALRLVADGLIEELRKVVALRIEGSGAAWEVGDGYRRAEQDSPGSRADEVEDVATMPMEAPHRVDEVRGLQALNRLHALHNTGV